MDWLTVAFVVLGVLLIAGEAVHLSLVPVFLGSAALIVAGLRSLGLVGDPLTSILLWSVTSLALALPLRPVARRYLKTGERKVDPSHEDRDAMGEVVEVIEAIDDSSDAGRIRFQGTTWAARTTDGLVAKGAKARLVYKDKLVWIVEPIQALDDLHRVPTLEGQTSTRDRQG